MKPHSVFLRKECVLPERLDPLQGAGWRKLAPCGRDHSAGFRHDDSPDGLVLHVAAKGFTPQSIEEVRSNRHFPDSQCVTKPCSDFSTGYTSPLLPSRTPFYLTNLTKQKFRRFRLELVLGLTRKGREIVANRKVTLLRYCKTGKVRPNAVLANGQERIYTGRCGRMKCASRTDYYP